MDEWIRVVLHPYLELTEKYLGEPALLLLCVRACGKSGGGV